MKVKYEIPLSYLLGDVIILFLSNLISMAYAQQQQCFNQIQALQQNNIQNKGSSNYLIDKALGLFTSLLK